MDWSCAPWSKSSDWIYCTEIWHGVYSHRTSHSIGQSYCPLSKKMGARWAPTVDLASPLLEGSWRSVLQAKSIFDIPVELMQLIESHLLDNELFNLCWASRDLYLNGWLSRRGMQDLRAFERSLRWNMRESFIEAVEALSDVPETASWGISPLYHMVDYRNVELI